MGLALVLHGANYLDPRSCLAGGEGFRVYGGVGSGSLVLPLTIPYSEICFPSPTPL